MIGRILDELVQLGAGAVVAALAILALLLAGVHV